jgi:hypothetical protein
MSEQYALYLFPNPSTDEHLASDIAALSGANVISISVALEEGGTLPRSYPVNKAKELAQALGLLGVMAELRASLPVNEGTKVHTATHASIYQTPQRRKHPLLFAIGTFFLCLGILGWSPWRTQAAPLPGGMLAPGEPVQETSQESPWQYGDYLITPLAHYDVTARVLSKKDYMKDKSADLSPLDLALGWGVMSDENVLADLRVSQSGRWFYVYWQHANVDVQQVMTHSANTHILPATPDLATKVKTIRRDDIVHLQGFLVEVTKRDGFLWRSSLTRGDTGDGSCEVLWVTNVDVVPAVQLQAQR